MGRRTFDCRDLPGDCTLTISGEEEAVVDTQAVHAVSVHGSEAGPQLRGWIRSMLKDEPQTAPEAGR